MTLTMYDSIDLNQIPADAEAVACYVNGKFRNAAEAAQRFPRAHLLTITVFASGDAECLDIEQSDATPEQAAAWYARQKARGVARPCLYASASVMDRGVIPDIRAAGVSLSAVRLWSAHYTGKTHRCGPSSCGLMGVEADATQYTDHAFGRDLDASVVGDGFFGIPDWQEAMMATLPTISTRQNSNDADQPHWYVHRVQAIANEVFAASPRLTVDGSYGSVTANAVRVIQQGNGLTADSVVGPATWALLLAGVGA